MALRNVTQLLSNKADVQLAILSINAQQIQGNRPAAAIYNVAEATLRRRRAGIPARRDCQPNLRKLTEREEQVIIRYILDLDTRGFAPTYEAVRDIANKLLAARGAS
ncbi:putative transposase [Alternaria alternata]|nr:putative transposase [Alternaria alternata]